MLHPISIIVIILAQVDVVVRLSRGELVAATIGGEKLLPERAGLAGLLQR